jgi:hypothetical protein
MTQQEAFELAMKATEVKSDKGSSVCVNDYVKELVKNLQQVKK